jgi:hypothetical protein
MKNKNLKQSLSTLTVASILILALSFNSNVNGWVGSIVPSGSIQVWGEQWNSMATWINPDTGVSLVDVPVAGVGAIGGDFPSLLIDTAYSPSGEINIISQQINIGTYKDVWFTTRYSEDLTANSGFLIYLGDTSGNYVYYAHALASGWEFASDLESHSTGVSVSDNSVLDVHVHLDDSDGYVETFLDNVKVDTLTGLSIGSPGNLLNAVEFFVDDNNAMTGSSSDLTVYFADLGMYGQVAAQPTPVPSSNGALPFSVEPSPTEPFADATAPPTIDLASWNIPIYVYYAVAGVFLIFLFGFALMFFGGKKGKSRKRSR